MSSVSPERQLKQVSTSESRISQREQLQLVTGLLESMDIPFQWKEETRTLTVQAEEHLKQFGSIDICVTDGNYDSLIYRLIAVSGEPYQITDRRAGNDAIASIIILSHKKRECEGQDCNFQSGCIQDTDAWGFWLPRDQLKEAQEAITGMALHPQQHPDPTVKDVEGVGGTIDFLSG